MSTTTTNLGLIKPAITDPADVTLTNENWNKIDACLLDKNIKVLTSEDDLNTIFETGFYSVSLSVQNMPDNSENIQLMRVLNINNSSSYKRCYQELISTASNKAMNYNSVITRVISTEDIGQWEWVNPPMAMGVEYRTTERYNREAVYVTLQSDGIVHKRTESGLDITPVTYGSTDLTAGTSELTTGQLYFVYE